MLAGAGRGWQGYRRWALRCIRWIWRPWGKARTQPPQSSRSMSTDIMMLDLMSEQMKIAGWNIEGSRQ